MHVFSCLLFFRFLYSDEVSLNADIVTQVLYTARKYGVAQLSEKCKEFLQANINAENVGVILENAHIFDEEQLFQNCMSYIFENPYESLLTEHISDLCRTCFSKVVSSDKLHLDEDIILEVVMRWGAKECIRQNLAVNDINCRKVLGDIFYMVRFPIMNLSHFADRVAGTCTALTEKEKIDLFRYMAGKNKVLCDERFVCRLREPFILTVNRLGPIQDASIENFRWKVGEMDKIDFSVSHDVLIHGVTVYGGRLENSTYKVVSWLRKDSSDEVLENVNMKLKTTADNKTYKVLISQTSNCQSRRKVQYSRFNEGTKNLLERDRCFFCSLSGCYIHVLRLGRRKQRNQQDSGADPSHPLHTLPSTIITCRQWSYVF